MSIRFLILIINGIFSFVFLIAFAVAGLKEAKNGDFSILIIYLSMIACVVACFIKIRKVWWWR